MNKRDVVQFGRTLALGARGRWFKSSHLDKLAVVAQTVERFTCNEDVTGSIPVNGS